MTSLEVRLKAYGLNQWKWTVFWTRMGLKFFGPSILTSLDSRFRAHWRFGFDLTFKTACWTQKDTIKRVMMKDTEEKQFGSMISCGRHLIKTYGFMRLFRGIFKVTFIWLPCEFNNPEWHFWSHILGTVGNLLRFWSSGLALALNDMLQDVIYESLDHLHCKWVIVMIHNE